jgi:hypothetical protein
LLLGGIVEPQDLRRFMRDHRGAPKRNPTMVLDGHAHTIDLEADVARVVSALDLLS